MEVGTALFRIIILYIIYKFIDYFYRKPWISRLSKRRVLITGCDTGFGYEIAKRLDKYGIYVFAGCLTEAGENKLKKECSGRIRTIRMDVTNSESVKKAYDQVNKQIPEEIGLWAIINNAGVPGTVGPPEWSTLEDYKQTIAVNLLGLIDTTVTFLPLVKKAKGRIVNTASMLGRVSTPFSAPYSVSKYGVEAFSDALRRQMLDFGVSVHLIEPGFHKTNMGNPDLIQENMRKTWKRAPAATREEYGEEYFQYDLLEVLNHTLVSACGEAGSRFDNSVHAMENMIHKPLEHLATDKIMNVVKVYEHAVVGRFPRARYLVGKDAKFLIMLNKLPEWVSDWVMTKVARAAPIHRVTKAHKH